MNERWDRFLTATQAEKSRLKTAPTIVESFMDRGVDAIGMIVGLMIFPVPPFAKGGLGGISNFRHLLRTMALPEISEQADTFVRMGKERRMCRPLNNMQFSPA